MMSGPATDALERSFKRIRVDEPQHSMSYINSAFNFTDAFDAIDSVEENLFEPFPKIAWAFDDDETDTPTCPSLPAPLSSSSSFSRKRNHAGLVRSKTFSQDLNKLAEEAEQSSWNLFELSEDDETPSTPSLLSSPRSVLSDKTFSSVSTSSTTCDASSRMRTSTSKSFLSRRPSRSMLLVSYGNSRLFSATNAF